MRITVSTPSRLHFGLLRFGQDDGPSYGGLGMMLATPRATVDVTWADRWLHQGPDSQRACGVARRVLELLSSEIGRPQKALHVSVDEAIPPHRGLGSGTQLALATTAAVRCLVGLPSGDAAQLAVLADRGRRSAVGSHGFVHGGLIWETGFLPGEQLGRLHTRVPVPDDWRVVLIAPETMAGLHGADERRAFAELPSPSATVIQKLQRLAEDQIVRAARDQHFDSFSAGIYEYGRLAGECFAPVQGGPYASQQIAAFVNELRALGVTGVGQSSWGPTVFAIVRDASQAARLTKRLAKYPHYSHYEMRITAPDNAGATVNRRPL